MTKSLPYILLIGALVLGGVYFWSSRSASLPISFPTLLNSGSTKEIEEPMTQKKAVESKPAQPATAARVFENGRWVSIIEYTRNGFVPREVTMNKGEEVRFVNTTSLTMRISFTRAGFPADIPGINQDSSLGKNGTYQVPIIDPGVWTFYNLNGDRSVVGVLNVL